MFLTELVLQGVRRFASPRKITFNKGLNVVLGGAGTGKSSIAAVIGQLLFTSTSPEVRAGLRTSPQGPSRAGISFRHGEETFRKVEDFAQGVVSLSKLNAQNNTYAPMSQDLAAINAFFNDELKAPGWEIYRILYTTVLEEFPSAHASVVTPSISGRGQAQAFSDPQALLREIQSLRKLHGDALKIKQLQFEIDGMHKAIFECQDVMKAADSISKKLEAIKQEASNLPPLPELPDDLEARAEAFEKAHKRLEHDIPQLEQEMRDLNEQVPFVTPTPPQQNMRMIGGVVFLVASIVAALVLPGKLQPAQQKVMMPILMFLGIGGFGLSLFEVIMFVSKNDKLKTIERDVAKKQEKIKAMERKFEVETSVVRNILKALGCDSTAEMFSTLEKIKNAQSEIRAYSEQLAARRAKPEFQKAEQSLPEMKKKAAKFEQELQLLSATPLDPDVLADQIAELEEQARRAGAVVSGGAATGSDPHRAVGEAFIEKIGRDLFASPTHRLVAVAAHALNLSLSDFIAKFTPPFDKNLMAFSFKNLSEPKIDLDGTFSVHDGEAKTRVRWEQLEVFKQDLVYFALKFTLLQFLLRERVFPVILDSALKGFDERIAPVLAKSMKFLSQQTQIILLTDQNLYAQAADAVENL